MTSVRGSVVAEALKEMLQLINDPKGAKARLKEIEEAEVEAQKIFDSAAAERKRVENALADVEKAMKELQSAQSAWKIEHGRQQLLLSRRADVLVEAEKELGNRKGDLLVAESANVIAKNANEEKEKALTQRESELSRLEVERQSLLTQTKIEYEAAKAANAEIQARKSKLEGLAAAMAGA